MYGTGSTIGSLAMVSTWNKTRRLRIKVGSVKDLTEFRRIAECYWGEWLEKYIVNGGIRQGNLLVCFEDGVFDGWGKAAGEV